MSKSSCYYGIVKNKVNKEDFVRKSYIELYSAIDAPESIDEVEFSDVFTETAQLVQQYTTYDITYTVEIGYDHEEQYIDQKEYYDHELKQYSTKQVVKNRIITDWQPYQGSAQNLRGIAVGCFHAGDNTDIGDKDEKINEQYGNYAFDVEKILNNTEDREATEEETKQMTAPTERDYLDLACTSARDSHFHNMLQLPGDRQRRFKAEWDATDMFACVYAVDRYKLAFDYKGQKCFIKQFSTEKLPHIYCSYEHTDNIEEEIKQAEQHQLNTDPEFQKNVKLYKYGTWGSLGLGFLSVALSQALGGAAFIGIILAVIGFILSYRIGKKMEAQAKTIQEEFKNKRNVHKTELQNKKITLLETRFAIMGLAPLSEEEKERFLPKNQHKLTDLFTPPRMYEDEITEEIEPEPEVAWED